MHAKLTCLHQLLYLFFFTLWLKCSISHILYIKTSTLNGQRNILHIWDSWHHPVRRKMMQELRACLVSDNPGNRQKQKLAYYWFINDPFQLAAGITIKQRQNVTMSLSHLKKNYNFKKLNWVIHSIFWFSFSQWKPKVISVTWTRGLQSVWQMLKSNHSSSAQTITPSVTTSANGLTLHGLMRGLQINKSSDDFWSFSLSLSVSVCVCVGAIC